MSMLTSLVELIFRTISDQYLRTAICVGFARVALSKTIKDPWVYVHAISLGALAAHNAAQLPDIGKPMAEVAYGCLWQDYGPFLAASAFSYIIGLGPSKNKVHDLLCAAIVSPIVFLAVAKGQVWMVLHFASSCWVGLGLMMLPGVTAASSLVRWGIAGGAASIAYAALPMFFEHVFPVEEMRQAYLSVQLYADPLQLRSAVQGVLLASSHVQLALGFLGLWYLRESQLRKNSMLAIRVRQPPPALPPPPLPAVVLGQGSASGKKTAPKKQSVRSSSPAARVPLPATSQDQESEKDGRKGQGGGIEVARTIEVAEYVHIVVNFIIYTALPYMMFRTLFETMDSLNASRFSQDLARHFRAGLLDDGGGLLVTAAASNHTISAHAASLEGVCKKCFELISRKLFSAPKLMLIPAIIAHQPLSSLAMLPIFLGIDAAKCRFVAHVTLQIQELDNRRSELESKRAKIEAHDASNARAIQDMSATHFTRSQWLAVAAELEDLSQQKRALEQLRGYLRWLYWSDILTPGIECAVAGLLASGQIDAGAIWVYARALEDGLDALLTRSRSEADLAALKTDAKRISDLYASLHNVTGANGSGKSSLFAVLQACSRDGRMPAGLHVTKYVHISVGTRDVVQVTQKAYCPKHASPLAWIASRNIAATTAATSSSAPPAAATSSSPPRATPHQPHQLENASFHRVLGELGTKLRFLPNGNHSQWVLDMRAQHDDYCASLSGGQVVKVELMRSVFLREECPRILLLDETFAPLDPLSKAEVQGMLKAFCAHSLILVIYHSESESTSSEQQHPHAVPLPTGESQSERVAGGVGEAGAGDGEFTAGEMPGVNAKSDVACLSVGGSGNNRFFTTGLHFHRNGTAFLVDLC